MVTVLQAVRYNCIRIDKEPMYNAEVRSLAWDGIVGPLKKSFLNYFDFKKEFTTEASYEISDAVSLTGNEKVEYC